MGVGGHEKVEEGGGDTRSLGDARSGEAFGRGVVVVATARYPPLEVSREPSQGVVAEVGVVEGGDELCVVDHVESFRQVDCHGGGSLRFGLVEALSRLSRKRQQGGGAGVPCLEAMLGWREREGVEFGEKEALEDLSCWTGD